MWCWEETGGLLVSFVTLSFLRMGLRVTSKMFVISCAEPRRAREKKSLRVKHSLALGHHPAEGRFMSSGMISTALHVSDANLMTLQSTQLFLLLVYDKMY